MHFYSNVGFQVRVSEQFVPQTSGLRDTLNAFAGKEVYKAPEFHGEISWTPETPEVTAPVKPRRLTCEPRDVPSEQQSVRTSPIRMTKKEAYRRLARNSSWKVIRKGKCVPTKTVEDEDVIAMKSEVVRREHVRHDSHGRHGRKPAYKQFATRRPKN